VVAAAQDEPAAAEDAHDGVLLLEREPQAQTMREAEPVFDPAEIVAPAAAPKRGWWRRGT
jgi:hypothetical protein